MRNSGHQETQFLPDTSGKPVLRLTMALTERAITSLAHNNRQWSYNPSEGHVGLHKEHTSVDQWLLKTRGLFPQCSKLLTPLRLRGYPGWVCVSDGEC